MGKNLNIGSVNLADKQYDLQALGLISGDNGWSTLHAVAMPYKTRDNKWHLWFNLGGTTSSMLTGVETVTITGVTFNSSMAQSFSVAQGQSLSLKTAATSISHAGSGGSTLKFAYVTDGVSQYHYLSGNLELDSKPTWATDFPAEQVVRADSTGFLFGALEWQGVSGCEFVASGSVQFTGASCAAPTRTLGQAQYGTATKLELVANNLNANDVYKVTVYGGLYSAGTSQYSYVSIYDGTSWRPCMYASNTADINASSTCTTYFSYTSAQPTVTFKMYNQVATGTMGCMGAASYHLCGISVENVSRKTAMPQIINSVGTNYEGRTVINSAKIASSGSESSICSSSPCGIWRSTGSWLSSVTRGGTGSYTVNFNTGVFSTPPNCTCTTWGYGSYYTACRMNANSTSSGDLSTYRLLDAPTGYDEVVTIMCQGTK